MVPLCLVSTLVLLFFYVSTFRSMRAVPNMAVFYSSLTSLFPGMSLTYFLNDLEMVPVAPIISGITLVFTFLKRCISIVRSLYFKIFLASFLIIFLSPGIATSINMHVLFIIIIIIIIIIIAFFEEELEEQIQYIKFYNVTSKLCIVIKFVSVDLQTVFLTYYVGMFMISFGTKFRVSSCSFSKLLSYDC